MTITSNPATITITSSPITGYHLVWSDEFNSNTLDTSKWSKTCGYNRNVDPNVCSHISFANSNIIFTGQGEVRSATWVKDANGKYKTGTPKFSFRYGYIEIKAKLAYTSGKRGQTNQLWMGAIPGSAYGTGNEVDYLETDTGDISIQSYCGISKIPVTILDNGYTTQKKKIYDTHINLGLAYHVYGWEWTPTYIAMRFDGIERLRITNAEFKTPSAYMYPIMGLCPKCFPTANCGQTEGDPNVKMYVDYWRIYQKN